jgi:hypothetical protein
MPKVVCVFAILVLFAATAMAEKEFTFDKVDNFDGMAVKMIKIDLPTGEISLVKSHTDKIEIFLKNTVYAESQSEADKLNDDLRYKAELSGDKLTITVEPPEQHGHHKGIISRIIEGDWNEDIYPALRVSIPDGKAVDINSASADIDVRELAVELNVQSASSDINLENIKGNFGCDMASGDINITGLNGNVSAKGISSDIKMTDIIGQAHAMTTSGDVALDHVKGPAKVSSTSGDSRLYGIDGDLDVNTASGDIEVDSATGSVRANSISGDIKLGALAAAEGVFDVESVSGEIVMELSRDFKGDVAIRTVSGSINSHISAELESYSDSQIRGSVGNGAGRLTVSTTSGDINIDRY